MPPPSPFVEELQRLLKKRGLSWRKLAELTCYDPSWLSKIKNGASPSAELVGRCDDVLEAGGNLIALAGTERARRPAQLPAAPSGFIGRAEELSRMRKALARRDALDGPAIVVVEGLPGVGKTATALRCAHDIVTAGAHDYLDGQLYADLRGHSCDESPARPDDVLVEFLAALGVALPDIPDGAKQRAALYRSLLFSQAVLIVLDNAASSAQVEPLLPGSAGCGVVVTSRRRLVGLSMRVNIERVVLDVLPYDESAKVLRTVIGRPRAEAEEAALGVIAEQCGHLPLALRIAAERAAAHPHRPLSVLVDELSAGRCRLDALAAGDAVPVREVFAWSLDRLGDAEARLFQVLALHPGPQVSVEAAAALAGIPAARVRRRMDALCDEHLLRETSHGTYRFHDLLRRYAAERISVADDIVRDRAIQRLTGWYLQATAAAAQVLAPFRTRLPSPSPAAASLPFGAGRPAALRWCDTEAPNFESIIQLAAEGGHHDAAWRIALALFDYHRLLRNTGRTWSAVAELAQQAAHAAGDHHAEARAAVGRAEASRWLHAYDEAARLFEDALAFYRDTENRHDEGWVLAGLGALAIDQGRPEDARGHAQRALVLFTEAGDRLGQASALSTAADACHARRRDDDALSLLHDALSIFAEVGHHDGCGLTLAKLAQVHSARGGYARALDHLDRSLQARRLAGSRWGEADGLARRGHVLGGLGHREEARASWVAAAGAFDGVDDRRAADIRAYVCGESAEPTLSLPTW